MKLKDIADVIQGVNFARVETNENDLEAIEKKLLTLKEFNEALGIPYRLVQEKKTTIWMQESKCDKLQFTREGMLVVHLLSQKAVMIPKRYEELLIPSNFVVLDFKQPVDAKFIEWYFNEHPFIRKQLMLITQGAIVSALSIGMLREMEISLPTIDMQVSIGRIIQAFKKKKALIQEKMELEEQFIHNRILEKMEEVK